MRAAVRTAAVSMFFLAAAAVRADEIVYFTNGTYMRIQTHEVQGDMVRVRLDGSASLAFPSRQVEKIEGAYGVVYGGTRSQIHANQALPSSMVTSAETAYPVGVNPALASRGRADAPPPPTDRYVPPAGNTVSNVYLDGSIMGSRREGPAGAKQLGGHSVIDPGKTPGQRSTFRPSPFQMKPGLERNPPDVPDRRAMPPDVRVMPPSQPEEAPEPPVDPPADEPDPGGN